MKPHYGIIAIAGATTSLANSTRAPCPPKPLCKELMLPISATANNTALPPYSDSTEPGVFFEYLSSFDVSALDTVPTSGTFNISALYCEPTVKVKGREGTIQYLLHGLLSNKEYWIGENFPNPDFSGQYSWVSHAASQGYATLAIDNLGNGKSDRPDPINIVQTPMQLSVVYSIMQGIRAGSLPGVPKYDKVVMGTHSYGSIIGRVLASVFPTSGADAYILTATAANLTGLQQFLRNVAPQAATVVDPRFEGLAPAYLSATKNIREVIYGLDGGFDLKMAEWDAASPHVMAVGEVASAGSPAAPSSFTGPVMVISGQQDQIACGTGSIFDQPTVDCGVGPGSHVDETRSLFPDSKAFQPYVVANTGHNVNTHYSAPESFGAAHAWLQSVGF
ncbi:Alpha/Beta hydrolase protein [Astrocystis sublimbata]|nr:Alpha/Beta hydrolase protein [Astrocystis sublimbata]